MHFSRCLTILAQSLLVLGAGIAHAEEAAVDGVRFKIPPGWTAASDDAGMTARSYRSGEADAGDRATVVIFSRAKGPIALDFAASFEEIVRLTVGDRTVIDRTAPAAMLTRQAYASLAQNLVARDDKGGELVVQVVVTDVGRRLVGFCYAAPGRAAWEAHLPEMLALLRGATFETPPTTRPAQVEARPAAFVVKPLPDAIDVATLYRPRAASAEVLQAYLTELDARRRPGIVAGTILGDDGWPVTGAKLELRLSGVTAAGDPLNLSLDVTSDGRFQQAVPDGTYKITARARVTFNGAATPLPLRALDEKSASQDYPSADGIVKEYRVTMSGLRPGEDPKNVFSYFGGTLGLNDASTDLFNDLNARLEKGTHVVVTLTPTGPLIDGSQGRPVKLDFAVERLHVNSVGFGSLPIGVYTATAAAVTANGHHQPLRVGTAAGALGESARVTWQASGTENDVLSCPQLYVGARKD